MDSAFASRLGLQRSPVPHPIQCRGFDGSLPSYGDIKYFWTGHIDLPLTESTTRRFPVTLGILSLSSANVILGMPWLKDHGIFAGGTPGGLLFPTELESSNINTSILPVKIQDFCDVFTESALQ